LLNNYGTDYFGSSGTYTYSDGSYNYEVGTIGGTVDTGMSSSGSSYYNYDEYKNWLESNNALSYLYTDSNTGGVVVDEWQSTYNSRMREYYYAYENTTNKITFYGEQLSDTTTTVSDACGFSFEFGEKTDMISGDTIDRIGGIGMEYYPDTSLSSFGVSISVDIISVIEYAESGHSQGYDSLDEVINVISSVEMSEWVSVDTGSADYSAMSATSTDGVLGFTVYVTNSIADVATADTTVSINANQLKFDVYLVGYIPTEGADHLAVKVSLEAGTTGSLIETLNTAVDDSGAISALSAVGSDALVQGFFSWVNTIIAYNGDVTTELTLMPTADEDYMYFSFNTESHADKYVWDPSVGTAAVTTASTTSAASFVQVSWIAVLLLSLAMFL